MASVVVSICALLFTTFSFWWLQARRGKIVTHPPRSYAGAYPGRDLTLSFPLVLHNTGAAPIVALDFRATISVPPGRVPSADDKECLPVTMAWSGLHPGLEPAAPGGGRVLPSPIGIPGRSVMERFVEFRRIDQRLQLRDGPYRVAIDMLTSDEGWRELVAFDLHSELAEADGRSRYLQRSNDPDWQL